MLGSSVAWTKIFRWGLILKMVPLRSPTKRLPSRVESSAGGDAHAFSVERGFAGGVDAVDIAFGARGDEEITVGTEGQAGGIEDSGDKRSAASIGADADDGDGGLFAALAGDGGVDHARTADSGTGDRVQAVESSRATRRGAALLTPRGRAHFNQACAGFFGNAEGDASGAAHQHLGRMRPTTTTGGP